MRIVLRIIFILLLFGFTGAFNLGLVEIRIQEIDYHLGRIVADQEVSNAIGIVSKYELIKRRMELGEEDVGSYEFEAKMQALISGDKFSDKNIEGFRNFYLTPVRVVVGWIRFSMGKPILKNLSEDQIFHVLEIGYFWERTRKYPDAIKIYDQVLEMQDISPAIRAAVLLHKAFCHSMISEYQKASGIYESVIRLYPSTEAGMLAWKLLAFIQSMDREREKVHSAQSNDLETGRKFFTLMDYRNAIKYFGKYLRGGVSPSQECEARFYKGRSHEELGETDEAVEEYRRVTRLDSSKRWSREAYRRMLMLGEFYEQKKQMADEARRQLEEYKDQSFMKNVSRFSGMVSESSLRGELMKEVGSGGGEQVQVAADARILALLNSIGDLEGKREDSRRKILEQTRSKWVKDGMAAPEIKELDRMIMLYQNPARKPAILGQAIRDNSSQLKYLYDKQLRNGVKLSGKVVVEIKIQAGGSVLSAKMLQSNVGDAKFEEEIISQVSTWKFIPVPDSLGVFTISYPFEFYQDL
jgi:TonB family protein